MMAPSRDAGFSQRQAEQLARLFNLAFTNTAVYGGNHPATQKSTADFLAALDRTFELLPLVTLMLEREFLYFDQWRVDARFNAAKLLSVMKKTGLQSISFERGVAIEGLRVLMYMLAQAQIYASVERMNEDLKRAAAAGIRLNYVSYRKITADEAVVSRDADTAMAAAQLSEIRIKEQVLREFTRVVSMKELLRNPQGVAGAILASAGSPEPRAGVPALEQLRELGREIRAGVADGTPLSVEEILEAVYRLKTELLESIRVQRAMGAALREEGAVLSEVDRLSFEVIVRMVREEYRGGAVSVRRLAQVMRRMLPDVKELRRMLPMLKEGLVAEGMPLADFLRLVQELQNEFSAGGAVDALQEGAEGVGLSVEDLVGAMRENPQEAAKLIVLAAEIRHGGPVDQFQLSKVLGDYVERVSARMALEAAQSAPAGRGQSLDKIVARIQRQLVDRLKAHGIAKSVAQQVDGQLAERFRKTLDQLKSDWLVRMVASGRDVSEANLMRILDAIVEQEIDIGVMQDQLRQALAGQGYGPQRIAAFLEQARARMAGPRLPATPSPGVLSINNTMFFLKHQLGMCRRYHNPFSTLLITLDAVTTAAGRRSPAPSEAAQIVRQLFAVMSRRLRDLDLLGSLGTLERNVPFVILPMTNEAGARVVRNRLAKAFAEAAYTVDGQPCTPEVRVSAASYDPALFPDIQAYVAHVKEQHRAQPAAGS